MNRYQFEVLRFCTEFGKATQREMAEKTGLSLGSVNKAVKELAHRGFLKEDGTPSQEGLDALESYRVESAIILAAGAGTRFAPLSFERPKALFEVRGEVLIERTIRQLREAGVERIAVVTGYMKESLFYLEDKLGVSILINPEYSTRNNHSSVWHAREFLGNTYIVSSDQYYAENVFQKYCYAPYCSAVYSEGWTDEQTVVLGKYGLISEVKKGGKDAYALLGPAYFDAALSEAYLEILDREYDKAETRNKLWEEVLADHLEELPITIEPCERGVITEFDFLTDLVAFDRDFFANVDSRILDNICKTLDCEREDITDVKPVKAGLTNLSTLFSAKGQKYIYRHPGNGTEEIVNREAEAFALGVARDLGLDDTFIYEEPSEGWKISRYIEGCSELDYADEAQVARALQMIRLLHESGKKSPFSFDFYDESVKIVQLLKDMRYALPRDFEQLAARIGAVADKMHAEAGEPVLCHNDFYGPNFLVKGDEMRLIDWEYAAMGDPTCDLGNFVAQGSGYTVEETLGILPLYYGRETTLQEQRHCLAAVSVVGWYWYVWAMYKEAMGAPVGEWLYIWYRAAKQFAAAAEELYGEAERS